MSSILTFSVYSLRVSSDIPVQSEYLPTISYYFIFVITFILIDLFWFIILNFFNDRKKIPRPMELYAVYLRKFFSKIKGAVSCKKKQDNSINPGNNENKDLKVVTDPDSNDKNAIEVTPTEEPKQKCNKCDLCQDCQKDKDKDDKKKKDKDELEANLRVLNLTAFAIILTLTFICNMAIWLTIAT